MGKAGRRGRVILQFGPERHICLVVDQPAAPGAFESDGGPIEGLRGGSGEERERA